MKAYGLQVGIEVEGNQAVVGIALRGEGGDLTVLAADASLYTRLEPLVTNRLREVCRQIDQERKNGTKSAATNTRTDQRSDSD